MYVSQKESAKRIKMEYRNTCQNVRRFTLFALRDMPGVFDQTLLGTVADCLEHHVTILPICICIGPHITLCPLVSECIHI